MSDDDPSRGPLASVLHPTDLSPASAPAFAHALRIAVANRARFAILHASRGRPGEADWSAYPGVRETLVRWGLLAADASRREVRDALGVRVEKVAGGGRGTLRSILGYLEQRPVDLMVLSTGARQGPPRWLRPSVAEPMARRSLITSLFVPRGCPGFVSLEDGSTNLDHVLLAVDRTPHPQVGVELASRLAASVGTAATRFTLLHVGEESGMPALRLPETSDDRWESVTRPGDPGSAIPQVAEERGADLLVMVTEGHRGVLDALRGSTTEKVLRRSPCPLLAVPAD